MPDTLEELLMRQPPTAERPLLGTVILVVEDSRHACETLRLICQRSGARIRRAESIASAQRHLRSYRPRIAVIDMGLPDGSGAVLIEELDRSETRIDGIIAISGDPDREDEAMQAGADLFLTKPFASVAIFQQAALSLLPAESRPNMLSSVTDETVTPDPIALRDDLLIISELLRSGIGPDERKYAVNFLSGLAVSTSDADIKNMASILTSCDDAVARTLAGQLERHAAELPVD